MSRIVRITSIPRDMLRRAHGAVVTLLGYGGIFSPVVPVLYDQRSSLSVHGELGHGVVAGRWRAPRHGNEGRSEPGVGMWWYAVGRVVRWRESRCGGGIVRARGIATPEGGALARTHFDNGVV